MEKKDVNHTFISFLYSILAIIFFIFLYIKTQNLIIFIDLSLGIIGFIGLQLLNGEKTVITFKFKPINMKKTFIPIIILGCILMPIYGFLYYYQLAMNYTTEDYYLLLLFCPAIEELFFRGFLITLSVKIKNRIIFFKKRLDSIAFSSEDLKFVVESYDFEGISCPTDYLKAIYNRLFEIFVVTIQAFFFCLCHTNYYNESFKLISVLILGYVFGLYYIESKDITTLMILHFWINFLFFLHDLLI